jgi:cell division protease FtsH
MVEQFGMSPRVGPVSLSHDGAQFLEMKFPWERERVASEEQQRIADEEVGRIVREAYDRARTILLEHEKALLGVADALEARETLDGAELRALVDEIEGAGKPASVSPRRGS